MFGASRLSIFRASYARGFATTRPVGDLAKLTLIGRLVANPEIRLTKTEKEYCVYTVATTNARGAPGADGERPQPTASYHRIMSFSDASNRYLSTLSKGTKVYVEAQYELKNPPPDADPSTYQGQRQIFLKHESLRVISKPKTDEASANTETDYTTGF